MKKLFNYLLKIGVQETTRSARYNEEAPAVFYSETYGDRSYFTNAPNFTYTGAVICFDYTAEAGADYFRKFTQLEKMLKTYCKKYGYNMRVDSYFYGYKYIYICKETDREKADSYYYFRDAARQECEQTAHEFYTAGTPEKINGALYDIMNKYGAAYNEFLNNTEVKTA